MIGSAFWVKYGEAAKTAVGFFWKSGCAFVLGYFIGAISSSCSFTALAAARALDMKGAHIVAVVAFMFASTYLVIELGILILIFQGWQFLAAEIVGGLLLIDISRQLVVWNYPSTWLEDAREKVESESEEALPLHFISDQDGR